MDIYGNLPDKTKDALVLEINKRIDVFDKTYSRFREDSLVWKISQKSGTYDFPEDADRLFSIYREMYDITEGLVTPLVGKTISDMGYDNKYSLKPKEKIDSSPSWDSVMRYNHPKLTTKEPILLDFGAAGKGYLIDIVADIIERYGIKTFAVDAGGDICCRSAGEKTFAIGLENPKDLKEIIGTITLKTGSLCGSAGNRRRWDKYHHIVNPKTLSSPEKIAALWIKADTTILADALSTALFFVEPETARKKYSFEYAILYSDSSVKVSSAFSGKLFVS